MNEILNQENNIVINEDMCTDEVVNDILAGVQNTPQEVIDRKFDEIQQEEKENIQNEITDELAETKDIYSTQETVQTPEEINNATNDALLKMEQCLLDFADDTKKEISDTNSFDISGFADTPLDTQKENSDTKSFDISDFSDTPFNTPIPEYLNNSQVQQDIQQKVENQTYGNPGAFVDEKGQVQKAKRNSLTLSNETFQAFKTSDAETIRAMITNEILSKYGGSIHKIVVKSGILIIDGIQPNITLNEVELAALQNCSSWSLAQHIENNELAPLFHWGVLKKNRCSSFVTTIIIDNEEYWYDWVIGDLFTPRRRSNNRRQLMFNIFPYLEVLKIGSNDYSIEKGAIEKIDISNRAEAVKKTKGNADSNFDRRKQAFKDNFGFKLHKGTSSMNKWTVDNFKNYATNRGKRGLIRFTGGLAARGVIALAATAINFVTQFIHAGITPIDELEAESEETTTTRNVVTNKSSKKKTMEDADDISETEE